MIVRALAAMVISLLVLLIALGGVLLLASERLLDRPYVRDRLVDQAEQATALNWTLGTGPSLTWQPLPQIRLGEIMVRDPQQPERPELHIQELLLAVPWSGLFNAQPWPEHISARQLNIVWPMDIGQTGSLEIDQAQMQLIVHPETHELRLSNIELLSGRLHLAAELVVAWEASEPALSGRLTLAPVDLHAWLLEQGLKSPLPAPLAHEQSLRTVAAGMDFHTKTGVVQTDSLWMRFDDSEAWGQAWMQLKPRPQAGFALTVDQLNLDPYLPGMTPMVQPASTAAVHLPTRTLMQVSGQSLTQTTPTAALGAWPVSGELNIQALEWAGLKLGSAHIKPRLQARQLSAEFALPQCYDGQVAGFVRLDPLGTPTPGLELLAQGDGIQLAPLLSDWQGEATLSGTAGLSLELTAAGRDRATLERSLAGDFAILVREARVQNIPLDQLLAAAGVQRSARLELPEIAGFDEISATFQGQDGQFHSEDIRAHSEMLEITGTGRLVIPEQHLTFDLTAMLQEGPQGGGINELNGLPLPLRIHGPWQAPEVMLDPGPALREAAARMLDEQLERHRENLQNIEERTGLQGLEHSLRQLLGNP